MLPSLGASSLIRARVPSTMARIATLGKGSSGGELLPRFLAPGLEALRLPAQASCGGRVGRRLVVASVRAEAGGAGAYEREAFVDANEAAKIAHVRESSWGNVHEWRSCCVIRGTLSRYFD